jgi:hypothetical protein
MHLKIVLTKMYIIDQILKIFFDIKYYYIGLKLDLGEYLFITRLTNLLRQLNDRRKYILKKYIYTINHKRIALNYLYLSM